MKAIYKNQIIAESDNTKVVEENHYFPTECVNMEFLKKNSKKYVCPWKGMANYYDVVVEAEVNKSAAWTYPKPKEAANEIAGHFAFWRGVEIVE